MLLTILCGTGQSPQLKNYLTQNVNSAALEKLLIRKVNWKRCGGSEESKNKVFQDDKQ